jgi:hypothetical protein
MNTEGSGETRVAWVDLLSRSEEKNPDRSTVQPKCTVPGRKNERDSFIVILSDMVYKRSIVRRRHMMRASVFK